jgi:hypothetical protein
LKKIVTVFIMLSLLISLVCLPAHAENIYPTYFDSLASTTGSYTSYKGTQEIQLLCSYTHPSSGDAGIYFYQPSAGLSASFIHSNNRRGTIMLAEKDDEWFNYDDIVTYYIGYFSTGSDGIYSMYTYGRQEAYSTPTTIEDDNMLELYLKVNIDIVQGDTSNNVPVGLFRYRVWAN